VKSLPSHAGVALPRRLGRGMLPSYAGDGIAEATCRGVKSLPSHADDGVAETTSTVA
jgi:hypothetical protein